MSNNRAFTDEKNIVQRWERVVGNIKDPYTRKVTAIVLENQAKAILAERLNEDLTPGATTTGKLGTFQKFAFPIVRRIFPNLIANSICGVQPMQGPVSQIFYIGNSRAGKNGAGTYAEQLVYSRWRPTYRGLVASAIGTAANPASGGIGQFLGFPPGASGPGLDGDLITSFDVSNVLASYAGAPSGTVGGQIAMFPNERFLAGFSLSAGERLAGTGIPEINFHIEQTPVQARTRKFRALWTIEASQDLKSYHDIDLESELTTLLSKELELEIDRELVEDMRMIAYGRLGIDGTTSFGGFVPETLTTNTQSNNFPGHGTGQDGATFVPVGFQYDFSTGLTNATGDNGSNVFVIDLTSSSFFAAPQHMGHVYSNILAVINFASNDIFRTTWRGPGTWLLTSPVVLSMLESAAKLEGGLPTDAGPSNGGKQISFKGKFAGKYDLYVDPLFPDDEILVGYKGEGPMDAGLVYAPYIPIQTLPPVTDPETFQPRKGIMTRYGKVAISVASRYFRVIRLIGPSSNYLYSPFSRSTNRAGGAQSY